MMELPKMKGLTMNRLGAAFMVLIPVISAFAEPTVTDVVAKQRYPWNGLVDITCKVTGINGTTNGLEFAVAAVFQDTGKVRPVSVWCVRNGIKTTDVAVSSNGNYRLLWDAKSDLGKVTYDNVVMRVTAIKRRDRVQLWDGGPYWATMNVGAKDSKDYGYYFWWGDTVGYIYNDEGRAWYASDGTWSGRSPFNSDKALTYGWDIATMERRGWITTDGVLTSAHDAAHVHWGGNWRMPTDTEFSELIENCTLKHIATNGVMGVLVTGKGAYADRSIFLAAAGCGVDDEFYDPTLDYPWVTIVFYDGGSCYWSSSLSSRSNEALCFGYWSVESDYRYKGMTVRPVLRFADAAANAALVDYAGDSEPFRLDTALPAMDSLSVAWDASWIGGDANATVIVKDNGTEVRRMSGVGSFLYTPSGIGRHEMTYTTCIGGVVQDEVYAATVFKSWKYDAKDGHAVVSGTAQTSGTLTIPSVIDGLPVTSIGSSAFSGCSGLSGVTIPDGVVSIASDAFADCSGMTAVTIPNSVTNIEFGAFSGCSGLKNVRIPQYICLSDPSRGTSLSSVFPSAGQSITNVVINDGVSGIRSGVFWGCDGVVSVTIPASVTTIASDVFEDCRERQSIIVSSDNAKYSSRNGMLFSKDMETLLVGVKGDVIIPNIVTRIGDYAFANCIGLNSVVIPPSVTSIGLSAFEGCSGLTSVTIGNGVTRIGDYAFKGCSGLTRVTIPDSVTSIGSSAFSGCSGLTSLTIPDSVTSIGDRAFSGCHGFTSVTIPNSVTSIGYYAFSDCIGLEEMTLPFVGSSRASSGNGRATSLFGYMFGSGSVGYLTRQYSMYDFENNYIMATWIPPNLRRVVITDATSLGPGVFSECHGLTSVTIPSTVTNIGMKAFYNCRGLTSVTIPDSVTRIGEGAFLGCTGLTNVTIPDSVTRIGASAFKDCSGLTSVVIPDGVESVGESTFSGCSGLTSLTIPDSVTSIGESAFSGCSGLTSVTIPDSVTSIGSSAFSGCSRLTNIAIPQCVCSTILSEVFPSSYLTIKHVVVRDGVTSIGEGAFSGCSGLTSVTIPDSVTSIGKSAFSECGGLKEITIPFVGSMRGNNESFDSKFNYIFGGSSSIPSSLKKVVVTDETIIAYDAFYDCNGLTNVTIPNSVTKIVASAFSGCCGLKSLMLPDGVKSIGSSAFAGCSGLKRLTIPVSVTSIGSSAFAGCSGLEEIELPFVGSKRGNTGSIESHFGYIFGTSSYSGSTKATWDDPNSAAFYTAFYIPSKLQKVVITDETVLGYCAFCGCSGLTSVTIPDGVTSIGSSAFRGCSGLTSVTIPDSVMSIGSSAFEGCSGITSVTIPDSVTSIGDYAFYGCSGLTSVTIPDSVTSIGERAFSGCSGLTSVTMPDSVTSIGDYAFYGCSGLTSVTIPDSVTNIGSSAFYGCSELTSVTIPNSVTNIGSSAFYGCSGLTNFTVGIVNETYVSKNGLLLTKDGTTVVAGINGSVTIPDSVTSIGAYAFYGRSGLKSVTIPDSVTNIGQSAFYDCSGLTSVTMPDSVNSIASFTFYNCSGLTSVTIPDSVTSIGSHAFQGCSGLTSVTIPDGVTNIGWQAFYDCSELTDVWFLGDCPTVYSEAFYGVNKSCILHLPKDNLTYNISSGRWQDLVVEYYEPLPYGPVTVVFNANGGMGGMTARFNYPAALVAPTVTREGYTFKGWSPAVPATVPANNVTYTAQWEVNKYNMIFDANGGTGGKTVTLNYGSALAEPTVTREGYTFKGWSPTVPATVPANNVTYTAQWEVNKYSVMFDANGGVGGKLETLSYGDDIGLPIVTREGYAFKCWSPAVPATVPASNVTYVAQWMMGADITSPDGNFTTVSTVDPKVNKPFNDNVSCAGTDDRLIVQSKSVSVSYDFGRGAKIIGYRMFNVNLDNYYHPDSRAPQSWRFEGSNDGEGWLTLDERSGISGWTAGESRCFEITNELFYTQYRLMITANNGDEYTQFARLEFYGVLADEGPLPAVSSDSAVVGALAGAADETRLRVHIPGKEQYDRFRAWINSRKLDLQNVKDSARAWFSYAIDADGLVEKSFENDDVTIKLPTAADNGAILFQVDVDGIRIGSSATSENLATVFEVQGSSSLAENSFTSDNVEVTLGVSESGRLLVRAMPKEAQETFFVRVRMIAEGGHEQGGESVSPTVAVTFDANGGTGGLMRSVVRGETVGSLPVVLREGYTFVDWWTAATGGSRISASTVAFGDSTYYAHWAANTYVVTYKPGQNGNGPLQTATKTHGANLQLKTVIFARDGFTQTGWSTSDGGSKAYDLGAFYVMDAEVTLYPFWTASSYVVTYVPGANGDGSQQTATKTGGETLSLEGALFTRDGYTQTGWSTSDGGDKAYNLGASYTANAAIMLYPFWTLKTYTITYKPGANGSGSQQTATKTHGEALTLKSALFTREGYTQTGWATSDGGAKAYNIGASYTANAELTLYPVWTAKTYTVTYKPGANGSGSQLTAKKTHDVSLTLKSATFTRDGYTQTGWSKSDGGAKAYNIGASYTANAAITLYPFWTANTYTVTYNPGTSGSGAQQTAAKTHDVAMSLKSATFTRDGYTQAGWSTSDGGEKAYELGASYTANAAITLYPFWTLKTYTITYKPGANGSGSQQTATKTHGVALVLRDAIFAREGYTQTGWSKSDGGAKAYDLGISYTSNAALVLYPFWTAHTYVVTYQPGANGTGSQQTVTKTHDVPLVLNGPKYTRDGFVHRGWATSDGGEEAYYLSESYTANAAVTLYPYWEAIKYSVTYKPGANGTGSQQSATKTGGVALKLKDAIFTRDGYTQTGWSTSDGGAKVYDLGASYTANKAVSFYPYWTVNTYTITYKPGASGSGAQQVETKTHAVTLALKDAIFTRSGYTQTGWSTSDGGAKAYDLGASYTANAAVILYPYWIANTYTVTYKPGANGTGTQQTATKTHDEALVLKNTAFTRDGYMQTGWSTSDGGAKVYELGASYTANKSITLYPFWTADPHGKVQLWAGGPYWATTNIGADKPEEYGYYFWWGDTVGYRWVNNKWVANDGSSASFSFARDNTPTCKIKEKLRNEGWITADYVLAPEHDAAHVQWGGTWRMPTFAELSSLNSKCTWLFTTKNGVSGFLISGKGAYSSNSIFLPCARFGFRNRLDDSYYMWSYIWSSTPSSENKDYMYYYAYALSYNSSGNHEMDDEEGRSNGFPIRPVQSCDE